MLFESSCIYGFSLQYTYYLCIIDSRVKCIIIIWGSSLSEKIPLRGVEGDNIVMYLDMYTISVNHRRDGTGDVGQAFV